MTPVVSSDNYTLQINPKSGLCNDDHLSYFKVMYGTGEPTDCKMGVTASVSGDRLVRKLDLPSIGHLD